MVFLRLICKIEKLGLFIHFFLTPRRFDTQRRHFRSSISILGGFRYPELLKLYRFMLFLSTLNLLSLLELWRVNKGHNLYLILIEAIAHVILVFLQLGCHRQFGAACFNILDSCLTFLFVNCLA